MGLFSGFFGKKKSVSEGELEIELSVSQLIHSLEARKSELESSFNPNIQVIGERLAQASKEMSESILKLESASYPSRIDDSVMKLASSFRSSLIKSFNQFFMSISKNPEVGIEQFDKWFSNCYSNLVEAEKNAVKFVKPLREVFPSEMKNVLKKIDNMEAVFKDGKLFLDGVKTKFDPVEAALADAKYLESVISKAKSQELEIADISLHLSHLADTKVQTETKIKDLLSGEAWRDHLAEKSELAQLQSKREDMRNLIIQTIISMERPMKRLKKLVLDGKEITNKLSLIDIYITDPFDAFRQDDGSGIAEFVLKISNLSKRGELELEEKERRMFEKPSELSDMLAKMRSDYSRLDSEVKSMEERLALSEVVAENSRLNEEVRVLDSRIADLKEKKVKLDTILPKLRESVLSATKKAEQSSSHALEKQIRIRTS